MKKYTIWVGDVEVNDFYIDTKNEADSIADEWRAKGYDDVSVEEIEVEPSETPAEEELDDVGKMVLEWRRKGSGFFKF